VKVFRALVLGAAITAAAIGTASTASADVGLVAGVGEGGVPASPLHFFECQKGSYQASSGDCVESPDQNANGAIGKCCDGTDTHAEHRSGACSSHGGVCQWFAAAGSAGDNPDNGPVDNSPDSRFLWLLTTDPVHPMTVWNFPLVKAQGLQLCQEMDNGERQAAATNDLMAAAGYTFDDAASISAAAVTIYCPQHLPPEARAG
jgi:hypothetical protein